MIVCTLPGLHSPSRCGPNHLVFSQIENQQTTLFLTTLIGMSNMLGQIADVVDDAQIVGVHCWAEVCLSKRSSTLCPMYISATTATCTF